MNPIKNNKRNAFPNLGYFLLFIIKLKIKKIAIANEIKAFNKNKKFIIFLINSS